MKLSENSIERVKVSGYSIPTDDPEGACTFKWSSKTLVLCEVHAGAEVGVGYTYGYLATAIVTDELASRCLIERAALDIAALHESMLEQVRNDGSRGMHPWRSRRLMVASAAGAIKSRRVANTALPDRFSPRAVDGAFGLYN